MRFKKGDEVIVVKNNLDGFYDNLIGKIGFITKVDEEDHELTYELLDQWFSENELELVEKSVSDQMLHHIHDRKGDELHMENKKQTTVEKIMQQIRENNLSDNGNIQFGDVEHYDRKKLYHIGDIMLRGNQINRLCELQDLSNLNLNIDCYSAMLNEKINDKSGVTEEENNKLAEHIYQADIDRLFDADIVVGEVLSSSIGSMCEMAMLDGFKFASEKMEEILRSGKSNEEKLIEFKKLKNKLNKDIYYHSFDLRNTNLKESGWRRSHSINQLQYAFMMHSATDGDILTWEDILDKLEKRYK